MLIREKVKGEIRELCQRLDRSAFWSVQVLDVRLQCSLYFGLDSVQCLPFPSRPNLGAVQRDTCK